ncbi:GRIP domain-containing protein [Entamoeba marina]
MSESPLNNSDECRIKELENQLQKQTDEVKRLKGLIIKQEDAQTEVVLEYEERITQLQKNAKIVEQQRKTIEDKINENDELKKIVKQHETEIEKQKGIILTLSTVGRKMKADQEALAKEKIALVTDELTKEKELKQILLEEKTELSTKLQETLMKLNELDELKNVLIQRNETITNLYEENENLKKTLEKFSADLQNRITNEGYYVDKRIVNKLLITFVTKPAQRSEIVEVMSKIMDFSDEERRLLGTQDKSSGILGYFFGAKDEYDEQPKYDLREKTFGDLWVEFLLRESGALDSTPKPDQ